MTLGEVRWKAAAGHIVGNMTYGYETTYSLGGIQDERHLAILDGFGLADETDDFILLKLDAAGCLVHGCDLDGKPLPDWEESDHDDLARNCGLERAS